MARNEINEAIKDFFLPPCPVSKLPDHLLKSGKRPTLHLLRRDLEHLYKLEDEFYDDRADKHKAPFLAVIGILSGIDLLSKFYGYKPRKSFGKKKKKRGMGQIGLQFCAFIRRAGRASQRDATLMWNIRNALVHSYSLKLKKPHSKARPTLTTGSEEGHWVTRIGTRRKPHFIINFWELKQFWLDAINDYRALLRKPSNRVIRDRFFKHYKSHGYIFVRSRSKQQPPEA